MRYMCRVDILKGSIVVLLHLILISKHNLMLANLVLDDPNDVATKLEQQQH